MKEREIIVYKIGEPAVRIVVTSKQLAQQGLNVAQFACQSIDNPGMSMEEIRQTLSPIVGLAPEDISSIAFNPSFNPPFKEKLKAL